MEIRSLMTPPAVEGNKLYGYASRFNSESQLISERGRKFREVILPGAFRSILNSGVPVLALWNHGKDGRPPLGRTPTTLQLREDADGLRFELELPKSAEDVREAVARGDVTGMSFMMDDEKDRWSYRGGVAFREVIEVGKMREISVVVDPAYLTTSVALRSAVVVPDLPSAIARAKRMLEVASRQ